MAIQIRIFLGILAFTFTAHPVFAQQDLKPHYSFFSTEPRKKLDKKRNVYFPPLVSLLLPSFDQWWEGQHGAAGAYLGTWFVGFNLMSNASQQANSLDRDFDDFNDLKRQYAYGTQLMMFAGELSAYQSFRTAMKTRQSDGEYNFLKETDETTGDLLLAPFAFSEVLKPTTFIPLVLLTGLVIANHNSGSHEPGDFTFGDGAFTAGISYNAGVGEEALFRGYLMPVMREGFGSNFWSNATTAVLFGAAHLGSNKLPIIQTLGGFYLGWLTQRNGWSLRQAIFLHTWWDVIAIGAQVASTKDGGTIRLPALTFEF